MKFKKKDLVEIIDTNGELIGNNSIPDVDANAETQAHNTSDYNAKIGAQPYRYDMLGRFGFTLMPFMEGKEDNSSDAEVINDLAQLINNKHLEFLKYYYKNPNKLKSDYRKLSQDDGERDDINSDNKETAKEILRVVQNNLDVTYDDEEKNKSTIDEIQVIEDKMINKKSEDEMFNRSKDREIKEKKIEKIAGLINKLEKNDIDKLINLLENNDR
jgi:hypothetical protein